MGIPIEPCSTQCCRIVGAGEAIGRLAVEDRDAIVSAAEENLEAVNVSTDSAKGQSTHSKLSNETRRCVLHSPARWRPVSDEVLAGG